MARKNFQGNIDWQEQVNAYAKVQRSQIGIKKTDEEFWESLIAFLEAGNVAMKKRLKSMVELQPTNTPTLALTFSLWS